MPSNSEDIGWLDEMPALPFFNDEYDVIPYGSLHSVAPYVSTPAAALGRAVELASQTSNGCIDDVVELGCGRGEFIRSLYASGWFQNGKVKRCRGMDIIKGELDIAREWANATYKKERQKPLPARQGGKAALQVNTCSPIRLPILVEFMECDIFENQDWAADASLIYIYLVPRMLLKLEGVLQRCCTGRNDVRIITYAYHFSDTSIMYTDFLQYTDNVLNLRVYCDRSNGVQMENLERN
jgi:SAM-dependent methyltransferase